MKLLFAGMKGKENERCSVIDVATKDSLLSPEQWHQKLVSDFPQAHGVTQVISGLISPDIDPIGKVWF